MNAYQVVSFILIGMIVFAIDKKKEYFPVPIILLLAGIGLSLTPFYDNVVLTEKMILHWFLPALLFITAYEFPLKDFKKYYKTFVSLSTIGMLLIAFLFALLIYAIIGPTLSISFLGALLIASILTPTDPVSVVNILKTSTNKEELADVVEGESLFNDGTSVVLFTVVAGLYSNQQGFQIGSFIQEFLLVSIGGILIGLIFGLIFSKVIFWLNHREYQVMVSIVLAYGSFLVAEHFGVSGVLATVTSGLMLSFELEKTNKNNTRNYLKGFWENLNPVILSVLIIVMGLETRDLLNVNEWWAMLVIFMLSILAREVVLFIMYQIIPNFRRHFKRKDLHIITWSGIKGTMSVALLLMFKDQYSNEADMLLSLSIGVIILSMVIQSLTIYPLSKRI